MVLHIVLPVGIRQIGRVVLELLAEDIASCGQLPDGFRIAVDLRRPLGGHPPRRRLTADSRHPIQLSGRERYRPRDEPARRGVRLGDGPRRAATGLAG